jgi:hypothetical protein
MKLFALFLPLLVLCLSGLGNADGHFESWYPSFATGLQNIVQNNCSSQYDDYLEHRHEVCAQDCLAGMVIDCMLEIMPESWKSNSTLCSPDPDNSSWPLLMLLPKNLQLTDEQHAVAGGAILLGLTPTILGLIGSSTHEMGILALRRPLLAFFLSLGSPAVNPVRAFEPQNPSALLLPSMDSINVAAILPDHLSFTIVGAQYILAAASCLNIMHLSWQLSTLAVSTVSEAIWLPVLWMGLMVPIYVVGNIEILLAVRLHWPSQSRSWAQRLMSEFQLTARQPQRALAVRKKTYIYLFVSWVTSTGTVAHIIFGTLVFSSMLFVFTIDAFIIVARFFISAVVCRAIVVGEISGMRRQVTFAGEIQQGFEMAQAPKDVIGRDLKVASGAESRSMLLP